ncbi:MAG: CIA30 family protein [Chloroflexi bacterium]|nr:CIA30 family protein [Chloroflexota bacterium]
MITFVIQVVFLVVASSGIQALNDFLHANRGQIAEESGDYTVLFDFRSPAATSAWYARNDNVMGGISEGYAQVSTNNTLLFAGDIRFENNGGFASIQTIFDIPRDVSAYDGVVVWMKGNGDRFGIYLRNGTGGLAYQATFLTSGEWQEIRLPFRAFRSIRSGEPVVAPPFDQTRLRSMSVMNGYNQPGKFAVEIRAIGVYVE